MAKKQTTPRSHLPNKSSHFVASARKMKQERRSGGFDRVIPEARRASEVRHAKRSIGEFRDGRPDIRVQNLEEEEENPPKQIYTDLTPE